jgi:small subunit ribosomal protein S11
LIFFVTMRFPFPEQPAAFTSSLYTLFLKFTRNNTFATLSQSNKVLCSISAGYVGLKKAKRGTSDAATQIISKVFTDFPIERAPLILKLKGFGSGRDASLKTILALKLNVTRVHDLTGIKHGGDRARKPRKL